MDAYREAARLRKWWWRMQTPGVPVQMAAHVERELRAAVAELTPRELERLDRLDDRLVIRLVMAWADGVDAP